MRHCISAAAQVRGRAYLTFYLAQDFGRVIFLCRHPRANRPPTQGVDQRDVYYSVRNHPLHAAPIAEGPPVSHFVPITMHIASLWQRDYLRPRPAATTLAHDLLSVFISSALRIVTAIDDVPSWMLRRPRQ